MAKYLHSNLYLFLILISPLLISSCRGDLGTAAQMGTPYDYTANGCGFDASRFPSNMMVAAAGEGLWNNGASCGMKFLVSCVNAAAPGTCVAGQTIEVMIVDRALTLSSRPSRDGTMMVLSGPAFQAIATPSAVFINIDLKQV